VRDHRNDVEVPDLIGGWSSVHAPAESPLIPEEPDDNRFPRDP